jgi:hypothetical protein
MHPSPIPKEVSYFPIDCNGRLVPRDQTHCPVNPSRVKPFSDKDLPEKASSSRVKLMEMTWRYISTLSHT